MSNINVPLSFGARKIDFVTASIGSLDAHYDAVVSSDDNYLTHSGGISQQLWSAAGPALFDEVSRARPTLHLGDVHATTAGSLEANWLLHAVTIDFDRNTRIDESSSATLVRSVLVTAEKLGCASIAIPLLGTGAARLNKESFLDAFGRAVTVWAAGPSSLTHISLAALSAEAYLLSKARELLSGVSAAEDVVAAVAPVFADAARRWLGLSSIPMDLRFYRTTTLLEEILRLAMDYFGFQRSPTHESPGQLLNQLASKLDDQLLLRIREAWMLRNRMAHRRGSTDDEEAEGLGTVNLAICDLLAWFADCGGAAATLANMPDDRKADIVKGTLPDIPYLYRKCDDLSALPIASIEACYSLSSSADQAVAATSRPCEPPSAFAAGPKERTAATTPIRELRSFVDSTLHGKQRLHFFESLGKEGYAGPDELRLLEFLIRVDDPAAWVANEFPYHVLQHALDARGQTPSTDDRIQLATSLLQLMGFPAAQQFSGIEAVVLQLENIQNEMLVPHAAYDGGVTRGARLLEYVCHVLIRFIAHAAFDKAPDILLRSAKQLASDEEVRDCTLGKLLGLLQYLADLVEQDTETVSVQRFKSVLERPAPLPKNMQQLAAVRNSFAHYKNEPTASESTKRARARTFIKDAVIFAGAVNGSGVGLFPVIVRVDNITVDRWGRRTVVAYRDDGRRETIFTDQELEAGQIYFMHPTTNPLRVDPVLVPAGKLWDES
jgi:O-acetyl-ADP-ribose deacetylase (regulator of RNase III)